ncbi:adenosylcobinamide-phosphate guanylyltransferase [Methanolinea mesophila]|uniref:NTP transferase domain-containing protein n=1 Tax=Methanolinea mesophila TaxID=547055 RepID=UPI001AE8279D|nr:NTP transferase domain-containing protein [Methanolinea mesophila]MBP1927826.1 adenosylcobinamide-phosphate guanylyltransferase [Methanolinea mesophila]
MLALILAGGSGSRLELGEKPLVTIGGRTMIERVIDAFGEAGCEPVVVLSPRTPYTHNWCRARGIPHLTAGGEGYVEDLVHAVETLEEQGPLFTSVSDLPCLTPGIIREVRDRYLASGKDACSVWVPHDMVLGEGCRAVYREIIEGTDACPAGINILRGDRISEVQDEVRVLVRSRRLVFNINTREELGLVQSLVRDRGEG